MTYSIAEAAVFVKMKMTIKHIDLCMFNVVELSYFRTTRWAMNINQKNIKAYDKKADNYDNTYDGKFTEKFKSLLLAAVEIKDGYSVLDIGCGNGTLLSRFAENKSIKGFGTDLSPKMIENAKVRHPELQFAIADCENIPFDDGSMDIITVCAAYHHFPNVHAFAAEAKRLLKKRGSLYIAEIYLPPII